LAIGYKNNKISVRTYDSLLTLHTYSTSQIKISGVSPNRKEPRGQCQSGSASLFLLHYKPQRLFIKQIHAHRCSALVEKQTSTWKALDLFDFVRLESVVIRLCVDLFALRCVCKEQSKLLSFRANSPDAGEDLYPSWDVHRLPDP